LNPRHGLQLRATAQGASAHLWGRHEWFQVGSPFGGPPHPGTRRVSVRVPSIIWFCIPTAPFSSSWARHGPSAISTVATSSGSTGPTSRCGISLAAWRASLRCRWLERWLGEHPLPERD